jgi:hypothetical protein
VWPLAELRDGILSAVLNPDSDSAGVTLTASGDVRFRSDRLDKYLRSTATAAIRTVRVWSGAGRRVDWADRRWINWTRGWIDWAGWRCDRNCNNGWRKGNGGKGDRYDRCDWSSWRLFEIRMKTTNLEISGTLGLGRIENNFGKSTSDVEKSGAVDNDLTVLTLVVRDAPISGVEVVRARVVDRVDHGLGGRAVVRLLLLFRRGFDQGSLGGCLSLEVAEESV